MACALSMRLLCAFYGHFVCFLCANKSSTAPLLLFGPAHCLHCTQSAALKLLACAPTNSRASISTAILLHSNSHFHFHFHVHFHFHFHLLLLLFVSIPLYSPPNFSLHFALLLRRTRSCCATRRGQSFGAQQPLAQKQTGRKAELKRPS